MVEAALHFEKDAILCVIRATLRKLLELLETDIDAAREIELATEIHRQKHLGLSDVQERDAPVARLEQRSDIALRGLFDIDDRKGDARMRTTVHAALNHFVPWGHRIQGMAAACPGRLRREVGHNNLVLRD